MPQDSSKNIFFVKVAIIPCGFSETFMGKGFVGWLMTAAPKI